jgi:hypothetical protein
VLSLTHHVYDHFTECLPLLPAQIHKDITVGVLEELEGHGQVVVLQHALVIVHQRQLCRAGGRGHWVHWGGGARERGVRNPFPVLEFLNNLWGLGTKKKKGYRTGPLAK